MNSAKKNDGNKPQMSLIPREALEEMAKGFEYGAKKYGRYNFELGMQHSRLLDAALRHLASVSAGEFIDAESGNSHLGHALCSIAMLCFNRARHPEMDDISRTREEVTVKQPTQAEPPLAQKERENRVEYSATVDGVEYAYKYAPGQGSNTKG